MTTIANPARPSRWLDRAFQIRLPVFVVMVAGVALVSWAGRWYLETRDMGQAMTREQLRDLKGADLARRRAAADLLDGLDPALLGETARALMVAMKDPDAKVRSGATRSLASSVAHYFASTNGQVPAEHDAAVLALAASMRDPDRSVRAAAMQGLHFFRYSTVVASGTKGTKNVSLGYDREVVTRALRAALGDPDPGVVQTALEAIEGFGHAPADALLPALRDLARSDDTVRRPQPMGLYYRLQSIGLLGKALKDHGQSPSDLVILLDDPKPAVRKAAASTLHLWRGDSRLADDVAARLARSQNRYERGWLIQAIADLGITPASAVPALVVALESRNSDPIRESALAALAQASPDVVGRLADDVAARLARSRERQERGSLIHALAGLRITPTAAVPSLIEALESDEAGRPNLGGRDSIQEDALAALANASPDAARTAMPALLRAMRRSSPSEMRPVVNAMLAIGPDDEDARAMAAAIAKLLGPDPHGGNHAQAVTWLSQLGSAALPALTTALASSYAAARDAACDALEALGPQAASAVPELRALARVQIASGDSNWPAADALFAIAPRSPEVGACLVDLLESPGGRESAEALRRDLEARAIDPAVAMRAYRDSLPAAEAGRVDATLKALAAPSAPPAPR